MSHQDDETDHYDESSSGGTCLYDILQMERSSHSGQKYTEEPTDTSQSPKEKLGRLLSVAGNNICADCGSPDPKWVSYNLGVFICIKCSGVHRSLGVHISKVLSANLDDWTGEQVDMLTELGGNRVVNMKFEACLPENLEKPKPDASAEQRMDFIRKKYEQKLFVKPDSSPVSPISFLPTSRSGSGNTMLDMRQEKHSTVQRIHDKVHGKFHSLHHRLRRSGHRDTKKSHSMAGMVEFLGLVKVNVVRGTNLVVRDISSSDPYVVVSLGNQAVRTRVIKKNLNPVWNEQLMLSIPENIPPLKIHVYDKDKFSTDDFMGDGEVNIQPLVIASRASETSAAFRDHQASSMQTSGTWKEGKNHDNNDDNGSDDDNDDDDNDDNDDDDDNENNNNNSHHRFHLLHRHHHQHHQIVKDSGIITLEDGTVKQEITIRLGNIGTGELEIELECVPLTQ